MTKIRHIALTTENPDQVAEFYKSAFDMEELRRGSAGVFLTDGYINLAILKWKTNEDADVGVNGPNFSGIHHIGFQVDDLDGASEKLNEAEGQRLGERAGMDKSMGTGPRNYEMKWAGPDGVVLDISHTGWQVSK